MDIILANTFLSGKRLSKFFVSVYLLSHSDNQNNHFYFTTKKRYFLIIHPPHKQSLFIIFSNKRVLQNGQSK